ncbi:MAG: PEP/pyruvate-binding domain-containing protein [Acidobacteriota bacterium]
MNGGNRIVSQSPTLQAFDRQFFTGRERFTRIGGGSIGGKAQGLARMKDLLEKRIAPLFEPRMIVNIPTLTVIGTDFFDLFMKQNDLFDVAGSDLRDDQKALAFQRAALPAQLVGDLRALIAQVHTPLAVRSSSMLEDAMFEPFASVYKTKMIPNNQHDTDIRFRRLIEAVKYVYASTYFKGARNYLQATRHGDTGDKMAVIVQEVVGCRHEERFYPHISGVARSYNFYPLGHAKPEDGVIDLALGLGKMIVDDGTAWTYSPAYPQSNPPYNTLDELLEQSQRDFWGINMGPPPVYDPVKEVEYMMRYHLDDAEQDGSLTFIASTYRPHDERLVIGIAERGARLVNFAPILKLDEIPLNELLKALLRSCGETLGSMVEIEFAVTLDNDRGTPARFGFLQVRPMVVSQGTVDVTADELSGSRALVASQSAMGNGRIDTIRDVIYVKPESFVPGATHEIAEELEVMNRRLISARAPYVLIGFGRWGTSDPSAGIPVNFGQISGAKVIVESMLPQMNFLLSQGSHFFHNITSFQVLYFSVPHEGQYRIDWEWLRRQEVVEETGWTCHVRLPSPLEVRVDGRRGFGVITHD